MFDKIRLGGVFMDVIKKKLLDALDHQCLIHITHRTMIDEVKTIGAVISVISNEKIRVHCFDISKHTFLFDDVAKPVQVTIPIRKITHIDHLWMLQDKRSKAISEILFQTNEDKFNLTSYTFNLYQSVRAKRIVQVDIKTFKPDETNTILSKNLLAVVDKQTVVPIVSRVMRYNVNTDQYLETDLYLHQEQFVSNYTRLKHYDMVEDDIEAIKKQFKASITLTEEPFYFTQKQDYNRWYLQRLSKLDRLETTRPLKAFMGKITPKNLGRKHYIMPKKLAYNTNLRMQFESMFKHPMTLINHHLDFDTFEYVKHIKHLALLNNETVCIVDGDQMLEPIDLSGVLDLRTSEGIDRAFKNIIDYDADRFDTAVVIDESFGALDRDVLKQQNYAEEVAMMKSLSRLYQNRGKMFEALRVDGLIEKHASKISNAHQWVSKTEDSIHLKPLADLQKKLNSSSYQKLRNLSDSSAKNLRNELLSLIKNPVYYHQLKQIFPVIVVSNTKQLPWIRNSFDCMVLWHPKTTQISDFLYADKVTIIDRIGVNHLMQNLTSKNLPVYYHPAKYGLFDTLFTQSDKTVKMFGVEHYFSAPPQRIYDVPASGTSEHSVESEVEAIERYVQTTTEVVSVRTPFVEQKRQLKRVLKSYGCNDVNTIFQQPKHENVLLSLSIHEHTTQKAYDWLKSQPALKGYFDQPGLKVFVDLNHVHRLASNDDLLYQFLTDSAKRKDQPIGLSPVIYDFLESLTKHDGKFTVEKNVSCSLLFDADSKTPISGFTNNLVVRDYRGQVVSIVALTQSYVKEAQLKRFVQLCKLHHIKLYVLPPKGKNAIQRVYHILTKFNQ